MVAWSRCTGRPRTRGARAARTSIVSIAPCRCSADGCRPRTQRIEIRSAMPSTTVRTMSAIVAAPYRLSYPRNAHGEHGIHQPVQLPERSTARASGAAVPAPRRAGAWWPDRRPRRSRPGCSRLRSPPGAVPRACSARRRPGSTRSTTPTRSLVAPIQVAGSFGFRSSGGSVMVRSSLLRGHRCERRSPRAPAPRAGPGPATRPATIGGRNGRRASRPAGSAPTADR